MRKWMFGLAALLGGCSLGLKGQPGLDERVGPAFQFAVATPGLVGEASTGSYGRAAGVLTLARDVPSETLPGRDDEWSTFGATLEGGGVLRLAGTAESQVWASLGLQVTGLVLSVERALPDDAEDRRQSEFDQEYDIGVGVMARFGYGWVEEKRERPKGHCERCHDEREPVLTRKVQGPEIGVGYQYFRDLGGSPVIEFTFLNLFF